MKKIAIHSVPRSGSSWVGQIVNSSEDVSYRFQPLFSYAFKDYLSEFSSLEEINNFFIEIEKSNDEFLLQSDKVSQKIYPNFLKNKPAKFIAYKEVRYHNILDNMLKKSSDIRGVGIVRNPMAVIHSFLSAPREFRKDLGWIEAEEWRWARRKNKNRPEEYYGYERWKQVCLIFDNLKKTYPENFYLISYDNLLKDTAAEVEKLFNFVGLKVSKQTIDFVDKCRSINHEETYSVFKKKVSDDLWRGRLNAEIVKEIMFDLNNDKEILNFIEKNQVNV